MLSNISSWLTMPWRGHSSHGAFGKPRDRSTHESPSSTVLQGQEHAPQVLRLLFSPHSRREDENAQKRGVVLSVPGSSWPQPPLVLCDCHAARAGTRWELLSAMRCLAEGNGQPHSFFLCSFCALFTPLGIGL